MKILVTGGAGFIGSTVVKLAIARGHSLVNLDALTYAASLESLDSVAGHPRYHFIKGDIRDGELLAQVFADQQPEAVLHLAAESHVDRSIDSPAAFIDSNVLGTFQLLHAARRYWLKEGKPEQFRFHHVSTDEVFGELGRSGRFTEASPYAPRSPYAASKAASDHLVRAWHATYGLPILLTNCSNNYGPYHFPEKFIPVLILNALAEKPLPLYGNGSQVRDWLYVEDHAAALLAVLERGQVGRSYHIGGEAERSNLALAQTLCSLLDTKRPRAQGRYADLIHFVEDRPGHDARYAIDPSRIRDELGWQAAVSLDEGLERTLDWYLANEDWWRPLQQRQGVGQRLGTASLDD